MTIFIKGSNIVDLSQTLEEGIPNPAGFPKIKFENIRQIKNGDVINVEKIELTPHTGTHIDAPFHFIEDNKSIDKIPPECILGSAVVVDLRYKKGSVPVEKKDIQNWENKTGEKIKKGDAVLLMTNYSRLWKLNDEDESFLSSGWPYMTKSSVDYLVSKEIRLIGVESMDLDFIDPYDYSDAEFIAHRTFLSLGIYIIENLTNLENIKATRCYLVAVPLKIKNGTGSPLRVLAVY